MSTTTEILAYQLLTPFTFTGEVQDYIMFLGLTAVILLVILKVYYLFFHSSRI